MAAHDAETESLATPGTVSMSCRLMTDLPALKVEVTFPENPRMWPAELREPASGGACVLVPVEGKYWRFATLRGRWKAYRKQLLP